MRFAKSRLVGIAVGAIAALALAATSYLLWQALRLDAHPTILGVAINFGPSAVLVVLAATIIARPRRATIAFWLAPLWVPLVFWGWARVSLQPTVDYPAMVSMVTTFFAYLGMLVVGLPAFLIMRARNWTSLRAATMVGAVTGLFVSYVGLVLLLLSRGPEFISWSAFDEALQPNILLVSTVLGVLVSTTFWAIARPDRSVEGS